MAKHAVIGKGNLGIDLKLKLMEKGHHVEMFTRSEGFIWKTDMEKLIDFDCVWVTAGFGSVDICKNDMAGAFENHTLMPMELAKKLTSKTRLVLFSTDYVANELKSTSPSERVGRPRSYYACTKLWMEMGVTLLNRPLTTVVRVGSLYGHHFPERCFPDKIKAKYTNPSEPVPLPQNWITPTPTWWAAGALIEAFDRMFSKTMPLFHHLAPSGNTTVLVWGRKILGDRFTCVSKGFDDSRPHFSKLGCSLGPTPLWGELWERHSQQVSENRIQQGLPIA